MRDIPTARWIQKLKKRHQKISKRTSQPLYEATAGKTEGTEVYQLKLEAVR